MLKPIKSRIAVRIDSDVLDALNMLNVDLQKEINEYLKDLKHILTDEINERIIKYKRLELKNKQENYIKLDLDIKDLQKRIKIFDKQQIQQEQKLKELVILQSKTCVVCGKIIENETDAREFNGKRIHKDCFLTLTPEKLKELKE